jgi:hypothetical protein
MRHITPFITAAILVLITGCGEDVIKNIPAGSSDFDIYVVKYNPAFQRVETHTIKKDGSGMTLLNDSCGVTSCSYNGKITLGKFDSTGFFYAGLYTANTDGTDIVKIPKGSYFPVYCVISQTGDKVLFTTDAGNYLCAVNADGTGFTQLSLGILGTEEVPKFSPDGKLIAYFESIPSVGTGLFITNPTGTYKKLLKDSIYHQPGNTLDWSPDGSKIVYQNKLYNGPTTKICVIDTSGMVYSELVTGYNPSWSPGGNKICYKVNGPTGIPDLYMVNPDGSGEVNLSNTAADHDSGGLWSRNESMVLYSSQPLTSSVTSMKIYDFNLNNSYTVIDSVFWAYWKY